MILIEIGSLVAIFSLFALAVRKRQRRNYALRVAAAGIMLLLGWTVWMNLKTGLDISRFVSALRSINESHRGELVIQTTTSVFLFSASLFLVHWMTTGATRPSSVSSRASRWKDKLKPPWRRAIRTKPMSRSRKARVREALKERRAERQARAEARRPK
jgi:hypothetical protein